MMDDEAIRNLLDSFLSEPWNAGGLDALDRVVAANYRQQGEGTLDDLKQGITEAPPLSSFELPSSLIAA